MKVFWLFIIAVVGTLAFSIYTESRCKYIISTYTATYHTEAYQMQPNGCLQFADEFNCNRAVTLCGSYTITKQHD